MDLKPSEQDRQFAEDIHTLFSQKPGAERIATKFALALLSATLNAYKPKRVIEYGAGIGTITYALLSHPTGIKELISTETNDFCLEQLKNNIPPKFARRHKVISSISALSKLPGKCDLMVFDGGFHSPEEVRFLDLGSVCFIEGARKPSRQQINAVLAEKQMSCKFQKFTSGFKLIDMYNQYNPIAKKMEKRIKFFRKLKGCWVGEVEKA